MLIIIIFSKYIYISTICFLLGNYYQDLVGKNEKLTEEQKKKFEWVFDVEKVNTLSTIPSSFLSLVSNLSPLLYNK